MICQFSVENYKTFAEKIQIDFYANLNIKRLDFNYQQVAERKVFKTTGFYGPNNTGKTCILEAIFDLRNLMLNSNHLDFHNVFAKKGDITTFNVEYAIEDRFYSYNVQYDNSRRLYVSESLVLKTYGEKKSSLKIFSRTANKLSWESLQSSSMKGLDIANLFSQSIPFMLASNIQDSKVFTQAREDYFKFAHSLIFLKMDRPLNVALTIDLIQKDKKAANFIKEFVKNCDLHIDDFGFDDNVLSDTKIDQQLSIVLNDPNFPKEYLKLYTKHNGYRVPTVFFDSVGTQKLIALSGYIYDALHNGKTLLIDEIDSSLHHIITKSIVAMFSNSLNKKAQLLFTTHDVLLMDLKNLFRKDQIYLVDIPNKDSSNVIRLSEKFTARSEDGIRGDEDITNHYLKGQFGCIPTPDLFSALEEAIENE